jgi:hypothetical protein
MLAMSPVLLPVVGVGNFSGSVKRCSQFNFILQFQSLVKGMAQEYFLSYLK